MIKKGEPIVIQRTENGYVVRREYRQNELIDPGSWLVFNDMGVACQQRDDGGVPSLLKYIDEHFTAPGRAATQQSQNSVRDATLREALEAGYSVPPATTNPSAKNVALESVAGKAATQSLASSKNQQVTNRLIRQDLGLADDVPLTPETLKSVRRT